MASGAGSTNEGLAAPLIDNQAVVVAVPPEPAAAAAADVEQVDKATQDVRRLRAALPEAAIICILGGTTFKTAENEELVIKMAKAIHGLPAIFVTGGMKGVQETFAKNFGDDAKLYHLVPEGQSSGFHHGTDIHAGSNMDERKVVFGKLGDIYITVEGGPGVAAEARLAHERGALVLPLARTGGASSGMFNFPAAALKEPEFAKLPRKWSYLLDSKVAPERTVQAVKTIARRFVKKVVQRNPYMWIPRWAVSSDVRAFSEKWAEDKGHSKPVPLGVVCGRGIFWATGANCIIWPGYIAFVFVAYYSCKCSSSGGLARYDSTLWLYFMFFFVIQAYMEAKALSYVIFCQVQATGPFNFLGVPLMFRVWAALMVAFSVVAHMDIASNSFFLATAMYSNGSICDDTEMNSIWKQVIDASMVADLDGAFGIKLTIPTLALFVWLFTFVQPFHAISLAMPICTPDKWWPPMFCWDVQYEPRAAGKDEVVRNSYGTCMGKHQNHGNALMAIAEVGRMTSVTFQDETFAMSRFQCALDNLDDVRGKGEEVTTTEAIKCLQHAMGLLQRSTFKFFVQGFLEMSTMLNLQISLLGIQRATTGAKKMRDWDEVGLFNTMQDLNWQIMLSICLSIIMAARRAVDIYTLFSKANTITRNVKERTRSENQREHQWYKFPFFYCGETAADPQVQSKYRKVRFAMCTNAIWAAMYIASVTYAVVKFWAVFYCPSSLWNFAFYPPNGCAPIK